MSWNEEKCKVSIHHQWSNSVTNCQANKTYTLDENIDSEEEFLTLTGIGTITAGDILLIEDEYVIINELDCENLMDQLLIQVQSH